MTRVSAPAYNATDDSPVRSRGRFTRPRRFTTRRTICLSAPAYNVVADSSMLPLMLRSSLLSVSRGLVYINTPGRTCLHELFIEYNASHSLGSLVFFQQIGGKLSYTINRRLHWMAQWAGAQVAATTVWLTSNSQLEGTIGRVADMAHTGSFITRHSHLNLLWIHIVLSTPMIYKLCRFISRSNMESLKPTPRVTFETRGLR